MKEDKASPAVPALFLLLYAAFLLLTLLLPERDYSDTERRLLHARPAVSVASVLSGRFMSDFESYALDHFPGRDALRTLKAAVQLDLLRQKDDRGLYRALGHLSALEYPLDAGSVDNAAARFSAIARRYLDGTDCRVYLSVAPDKNRFLAPEAGYPHLDYDALTRRLRENLPDMSYIDLDGCLTLDDYYRTDPHWRQERLQGAAERLLSAMGAQTGFLYTAQTLTEDFRGVYAGQLPLPVEPEALTVLRSDVLERCRAYDWENGREIPVYDAALAGGRDPYEAFLSGALSLITVENPAGPPGRELILFRDSFGSSMAPLLVGAYSRVTLVDIRYLSSDALGRFLDFRDQDVLFLYSTLVLNNSDVLK